MPSSERPITSWSICVMLNIKNILLACLAPEQIRYVSEKLVIIPGLSKN